MIAGAGSLVESLVPATVRLTVEPGDGVAPVRGDRGQLEQVLTNLVVNGVDAMPQGGDLKVSSGRDGEEFAWLEVEDAGMGIPADVRARLFEPFFTTKKGGTGLGLSVTQGIVTGLGGRIEVTSEIGKGSTFRVVLPMLATAEPNESLADPRIDAGSSPAVRGERILVVEDEEDARAGLIEALGMLGYRIVGVGSGEEALRAAGDSEFDLLLSDVKLPGVQGGAVARLLKARWPSMRVIVMSGYTEDVAMRADLGSGSFRFLQKPFDMKTLAREVRAALEDSA
jgi:CheY-like chemotaxis protein